MPKKGHSEEQIITALKQYESGEKPVSIEECKFAADSSGRG